MRPETLARYEGRLTVESAALGNFEVEVPAAPKLEREIDALWVAVKAMELEAALRLATPEPGGIEGTQTVHSLNRSALQRGWRGPMRHRAMILARSSAPTAEQTCANTSDQPCALTLALLHSLHYV
jgi:hypothetical protein